MVYKYIYGGMIWSSVLMQYKLCYLILKTQNQKHTSWEMKYICYAQLIVINFMSNY